MTHFPFRNWGHAIDAEEREGNREGGEDSREKIRHHDTREARYKISALRNKTRGTNYEASEPPRRLVRRDYSAPAAVVKSDESSRRRQRRR